MENKLINVRPILSANTLVPKMQVIDWEATNIQLILGQQKDNSWSKLYWYNTDMLTECWWSVDWVSAVCWLSINRVLAEYWVIISISANTIHRCSTDSTYNTQDPSEQGLVLMCRSSILENNGSFLVLFQINIILDMEQKCWGRSVAYCTNFNITMVYPSHLSCIMCKSHACRSKKSIWLTYSSQFLTPE